MVTLIVPSRKLPVEIRKGHLSGKEGIVYYPYKLGKVSTCVFIQ